MNSKGYVQCRECGYIHREEMNFNIEELFIRAKCPRCGKMKNHMWVGDDPSDIYLYADPVLDERYYNYNTK